MIEDQNFSSTSMDSAALQRQVLELRRQLVEARARNRMMWALLAEISQRLQVSSTSIKAAVSSLLDYDIFWDGSTQHEFLETIDDSVDQGADLIALMTLAFRSEANSLEMKLEPHALPEILSTVLDTTAAKMPGVELEVDFPPEGEPVFVDYRYLAVALSLLLEVLLEPEPLPTHIALVAMEAQDSWGLEIEAFPEKIGTAIGHLCQDRFDELLLADNYLLLSPEKLLKLFTVSRIFRLQDIQLDVQIGEADKAGLRLTIPAARLGK
jgi:K+-sensing histidine kinase KdpD